MSAHDYNFITHWRLKGRVEDVADVLERSSDFPRWWPSVYLRVDPVSEGDEGGVGRTVRLHSKGWLPYTLRWESRVTESHKPYGFTIAATGDFNGRGSWTFEQAGDYVNATFDWRLRAEKPLLRYFSFLLKPLFSANHRWAMARGEESLQLELERRGARTEEERAAIAAPPGPTFRKMNPGAGSRN